MRLFFTLLAVAAFCVGMPIRSLYPFIAPAYAQNRDNIFTGHVVAVTAGDTMDVRVGDDWTVTVRLHGIECPNSPRSFRETATRYTSRLVLDTDVRVEVRGTASRSVVYGEVFPATGGESVNFTLARDGVATWASAYAASRTDIEDAEAYAKSVGRGLWGAEDGSNITLPESVAEKINRSVKNRVPVVRKATPKPATPRPAPTSTPRKLLSTPLPSPKATPRKATPPQAIRTDAVFPLFLMGGISVGVLTFLSLIAYGVANGLSFTPKRITVQVGFALITAVLGAGLFTLPVADVQRAFEGGDPTPVIVALIAPIASLLLLRVGTGIMIAATRLRGQSVDPRVAEPGPVKLHGVARGLSEERVHSDVGAIRGLYVREVTSRYTAETESGKRLGSPRWVVGRDTVNAVDFELFSSAGDGTGSALILSAQDEDDPQSLAPARWIPYHVARFYNEVPADTWFATAYEGDTRTEVFFVPNGATLTVWGNLYAPAPEIADRSQLPVPRVASDSAIGALLICDGPEVRAYAGRGVASLPFGMGWGLLGLVCAGGTFWGATQGALVARQTAIASLAVGLAVLFVLAICRGAALARNAEREEREKEVDPLRRPANAIWERYQKRVPGAIIAPLVGEG